MSATAVPFKMCSHYMDDTRTSDYNLLFKKAETYFIITSRSRQLHYHEYYQLYYLTQGSMLNGNGTTTEILYPGDLFIIPPNTPHYVVPLEEETYYYSLTFYPSFFSPNFNLSTAYKFLNKLETICSEDGAETLRLCLPIPSPEKKDLEGLFACLLHEKSLEMSRTDTMAASLISCILTIVSRIYFVGWTKKSSPVTNETLRCVLSCIEYIDQNYMLPLREPDLAKHFTISISTMGTMFKKLLGMGFKDYLNYRRIEYATAYLAEESLTIFEIAHMVGYNDMTTFYRNFKRRMKVSPKEYRESLHNSKTEEP